MEDVTHSVVGQSKCLLTVQTQQMISTDTNMEIRFACLSGFLQCCVLSIVWCYTSPRLPLVCPVACCSYEDALWTYSSEYVISSN